MEESWILELLLPELTHYLKSERGKIVYHYLSCADEMNRKLKYPLHRAVLTACFLFPLLEDELQKELTSPSLGDVIAHTSETIKQFITQSFSHFPKRLILTTNFILTTQYRFAPFSNRHPLKTSLLNMKEFSLALQFYKIRATLDHQLRKTYLETVEQYDAHKTQKEHRKPHYPPVKKR